MKNQKKIYLIICIVSLVIVLAALSAIGIMLISFKRAEADYNLLASQAKTSVRSDDEDVLSEDAALEEGSEVSDVPDPVDIPVDFEFLKGENQDIIGWIQVDGTTIDYPILYDTTYNRYYLNHNFKGTNTAYGSIFVLGEMPTTLRTSTPWSMAITCWTAACLPSCISSGSRSSSIPMVRSLSTPRTES